MKSCYSLYFSTRRNQIADISSYYGLTIEIYLRLTYELSWNTFSRRFSKEASRWTVRSMESGGEEKKASVNRDLRGRRNEEFMQEASQRYHLTTILFLSPTSYLGLRFLSLVPLRTCCIDERAWPFESDEADFDLRI